MADEFPLPGLIREVTEGYLSQAKAVLRDAERDVRLLLDGKERSSTFKPDTDPVEMVIEAARQLQRCETVIEMDDRAREEQ